MASGSNRSGLGTIRTFDEAMRDDIHARVKATAEAIALASRAGCEVCIRSQIMQRVHRQLGEDPLSLIVRVGCRIHGPDRPEAPLTIPGKPSRGPIDRRRRARFHP